MAWRPGLAISLSLALVSLEKSESACEQADLPLGLFANVQAFASKIMAELNDKLYKNIARHVDLFLKDKTR